MINTALEVVLLILVAIPALLGGLIVHELGHLLAGKIVGLRMAFFVAGPLQAQATEHQVQLAWNKRLSLYGGAVACIPTSTKALSKRFFWFIAGGPSTSLICGLAALGLYYSLGLNGTSEEYSADYYLGFALFIFSMVSVSVGLITLVPNTLAGTASDGKRLLGLRKSQGRSSERNAAVMALGAYALAGQRPSAWPEAVLQKALSVPDGSHENLQANHLAYFRALDGNHAGQAQQHLQYALKNTDQAPPAYLSNLFLEAAYFNAAYAGQAEAAQRWHVRIEEQDLADDALRLRAEAAMLLLQNNNATAQQKIRAAYNQVGRAIDKGLAEFTRSELKKLEAGTLPIQKHPIL